MITPKVFIMGNVEQNFEKNIDTGKIHVCGYEPDDKNIQKILAKQNPNVIVSVGAKWESFQHLSALPLSIRKKWLHFQSASEISIEKIINCFVLDITSSPDPKTPKVTIFTTTFNSGEKIKRPLGSLLSQTYQDWEWIIVDDSDDNGETFKMLAELEKNEYRIKLFKSSSHSGFIGKVKREAAMLGTGSIFVELDHDDDILPDTLQLIVNAFIQYPEVGFVYTDFSEIYEDDLSKSHQYPEKYALGFGSYVKTFVNGNWINAAQSVPINATTMRHIVGVPNHIRAWRSSAYYELGGHNPNLHVADDYDLILRTVLKYDVCRIPRCQYLQYRNRGGNNFTFIRNKEIQKLCFELWCKVYAQPIKQKMEEYDVYIEKENTSCLLDWEKDPKELVGNGKRGSEFLYDPEENHISIILIVDSDDVSYISNSIYSIIDQSYQKYKLYIIGYGSEKLAEIMENDDFKLKNIFWWSLENKGDVENAEKFIINYALKMLVTTKYVTYMKSGVEWSKTFLHELSENIKLCSVYAPSVTLNGLIHEKNILEKTGYFTNEVEFLTTLLENNNFSEK